MSDRPVAAKQRIYVAASWRTVLQPVVVLALRKCGHDVGTGLPVFVGTPEAAT